ncbi:MAG: SusC/RagA family TonB-linked outer membrane protein [Dysgonamonadaceae bacterium]|jgi:TonB-linked SusC/RagA family outer membrane protein|nr:SusC/RagA family TonB-linked outer membrane protein [Dysgonamonadaceae bacterium]
MKKISKCIVLCLFLFGIALSGYAQDYKLKIQGKVIDETQLPLPGAVVRLKSDPGHGAITNEEGIFTIMVPDYKASLIVSYVGYGEKEIPLKMNTAWYDIQLDPNAELQEVVVFGYFKRAKDSFTGSAVTVSGEELKQINPNNILKSIESFDPSFKMLTDNLAGSNPNRLPNINVRGVASLPTGAQSDVLRRDNIASNVNLPTFILDGYEVSVEKIYDLDVNRIASITLLKDAAATAIYGSRASNGVLVITTTAPKEGKIQVSYNYELSANLPDLSSYSVLNAGDKLEYERLAGVYETEGLSLQEQEELYYKKLYNVVSGIDTDWLAQPVRNALGNKHSLYIEGGSESIRYGITGLYQSMPGVMKESGRNRYGIGMDLSYHNGSKLLFKNTLSISRIDGQDTPYGNFSEYVRMNPYYPKTDTKGQIVQQIDTWTDRSGEGNSIRNDIVLNPLYDATLNSFYKSRYWEINDAFTAEWNILEGLRLRGVFSFYQKNNTGDRFISPYDNSFFTETNPLNRGSYLFSTGEETSIDGSSTLTYSKQINSHFFNMALGLNVRQKEYRGKSFTAIGFTNDRFSEIGFAGGYKNEDAPLSSVDLERLFGSFFSLNYSFKDRYLVDASFRADGSSKFGDDNKVAPFWAAGIGWNLHHENFVKDLQIFSQLRIKANAGLTGSVSFSPFMANTLYEYNKNNWYSTGVGAGVTQYGNKNLKWQRTDNKDIGLDIGLLKDRFYFSGRYYNRLTKDMLTDITLPPSTGFGYYKDNLGDIENRGYEFGLKLNIVKTKDWNISLNGNFVHNKNKLIKISNSLKKMNDKADQIQEDLDNPNAGIPLLRYEEGQSINTIYAVRSLGIDPENGKEIFVKKDGSLTYNWDVKDIVPICDATPQLDGFFGGNIYYKGFVLNLSFYTRFGGYDYNQTLIDKIENANPRYNVDSRAMTNRWKNPGDKALYKDIQNEEETRVTQRFIQKDNLLELRSIYLSYDFNAPFMKKIGMRTLRAAVTVNDIWRTSSIVVERGIDYPFAKSFTLSLQANF